MITHRESTVPNRLPRYAHPSSPGVRTSSLHEPTASPEREVPRAHAFHASAGRAVVSVQSSVKTSLKASYKPVSDPGHGPAGSARDPPVPRPHGRGGDVPGALISHPPVSLKSRRKFWESCFTACSLNNLMISRIVGNGGRRKVVSVPEAAMSLGGAVQASRNRSQP